VIADVPRKGLLRLLEPLSDFRRNLLLSLNLCTAGDLRRASRHVRRLAHDLPAFDSIWLDSLVRIGKLTPFQARILESSSPDRIRLGPCLLVERLGGGPLGETFLASTGRGHKPCVVKRLTAVDRLSAEAEERLAQLVENLHDLSHPAIAAPFRFERVEGEPVLVSRYVSGLHLGELLVRRGRIPPAIVWEIARQAAGGLYALEQRGVAHGDIRAANVRLTKAGGVVLVDTGIRAAVDPELSVHSGLPPDRYDGVAPELIGTVTSPTISSDIYAFGCLLWQLLAGRPPFPGGDPLVKLAAHQTRSIDDVRQWAPATPQPLAEGIRRLTSRNPADRPAGFAEVLEQWGGPSWRGHRRLAAFRRQFDAKAPMRIEPSSRSRGPRWPILAGMLLVALVAISALQHEDARSVLMAWRSHLSSVAPPKTETGTGEYDPPETSREVQTFRREAAGAPAIEAVATEPEMDQAAIPDPDQHGVVRLTSPGPYRARGITTIGSLTIVTEGPIPAEILIGDTPLDLTAETVRIENIQLRHATKAFASSGEIPPLLQVQTQSLQLERTVLIISELPSARADAINPRERPLTGIGLDWKLVDPRDPQGGMASIRNCLLIGGACALRIGEPVRHVEFTNCLRLTGGPLGQFTVASGARNETVVRLDRTTCRETTALFRLVPSNAAAPAGRLSIDAKDCVLDLLPPHGCLFELADAAAPGALMRVAMTGEGSLAPATLVTAVRRSSNDAADITVDPSDIPIEGILAGPYRFAGPLTLRPADAEMRHYEVPRRSTIPPGIDAKGLPAPHHRTERQILRGRS
jgi:eukaryotic-like serine/threonine-protein kinase